jgi:hypothetical protein
MTIPAYLWLKDDGGANIRGSVDVVGREGSIEIHGLNHGVSIPTDDATGKATAIREHVPYIFSKDLRVLRPLSWFRHRVNHLVALPSVYMVNALINLLDLLLRVASLCLHHQHAGD